MYGFCMAACILSFSGAIYTVNEWDDPGLRQMVFPACRSRTLR
jgi:hypothetical protein